MTTRYFIDTNVLISYFSRDFFLELGKRGLPIRWSLSIEAEFRDVWARLYPRLSENGPKILQLMRTVVPDWRAPESRRVLREVTLPDVKDRHVLAAAVRCSAQVVITSNRKHFPVQSVIPFDIEVLTPDEFLINQHRMNHDLVMERLNEQASACASPIERLLLRLARNAPRFVEKIRNKV